MSVVVFDLGGTSLRIGASHDRRRLAGSRIIPAPRTAERGVPVLAATARSLLAGHRVELVVGGLAGPIDHARGCLRAAPHLPGWVGRPIRAMLEAAFRTPALIENDAILGGLGEATYGAGRGARIVAYLAVGTGIGGSRIVDGQPDANAQGFEPGHLPLDPNSPARCACGAHGDFESLVSGTALALRHGRPARTIAERRAWRAAAATLGRGLVSLAVLWSPDRIVLGGSLMRRIALSDVRRSLAHRLRIFPSPPPVVRGTLSDRAGLYGALQLARRRR